MIELTKKQLFDLQFKYMDIKPKNKLGEPIKEWWKNDSSWYNISFNIDLKKEISIEFIRDFKDYLKWSTISTYKTLSEDFIREFKDYVDWYCILFYQKLSKEFIDEIKKKGYIKYEIKRIIITN